MSETGIKIAAKILIRSKLKACWRPAKGRWTARGSVPIRQPSGAITYQRREFGLTGDKRDACEAEVDALNAAFEREATADHADGIIFARAYINYINATKKAPLRAEEILEVIGPKRCLDITDTDMTGLQEEMFEVDNAPSYINRHLHTPVIAILNMALKQKAPRLTRPKGHKDRAEGTEILIPSDEWYGLVTPHMNPNTVALTYFLAGHGRRLGDALGRRPHHFNPEDGTLTVRKTKTGGALTVELHPSVTAMILSMPNFRKRQWLFGDGPASGSNVRKDILKACARAVGINPALVDKEGGSEKVKALCKAAGVPYYNPHSFGRHAFATRMLRAGYSLQYVKDAGGWASIEVLSKLYGHLEKKEWTEAVHKVADGFIPIATAPSAALLLIGRASAGVIGNSTPV